MRKYITYIILSCMFGICYILNNSSISKAVISTSIDESTVLEYGEDYSYTFKETKAYDKYTITYLMYSADSDSYYVYSDTKESATSLSSTTINQTFSFDKLKTTTTGQNLNSDSLQITIELIKKEQCGFQNMETNCLIRTHSTILSVELPDITNTSPSNGYKTTNSSITLSATSSAKVTGYYFKKDGSSNYEYSDTGSINLPSDGTYFWYARNEFGKLSSEYTLIKTTPDAIAPTLTSPANGTTVIDTNVELVATDNIGVTAYYYKKEGAVSYTKATSNKITVSDETKYFWYAVDAAGNKSNIFSFNVSIVDVTAPTLISPTNGATINTVEITLVAQDNKQVAEYWIKKEGEISFSKTTPNVINLEHEASYTWYAVDNAGNKSSEYTFTYVCDDFEKPLQTYPQNRATIVKSSITLTATDNKAVKGYYYKNQNDSDYTFSTNGKIENLLDETTYSWYVIDTSNNTSDVFTFFVYLEDVTKPNLVSPINNSIISESNITLTATDNRAIKGYYYKLEDDTTYTFTETGELTGFNKDATYNWYAVDTSNNESEVFTFTYLTPDTTNPVATSPTNEAIVTTLNVQLTATDNRAIAGYYYKESSALNWSFSVNGALTKLKDETTYEWYAVDTSNNESEILSFKVSKEDVSKPSATSPSNGGTLNTINVQLTGSDDKAVAYYTYRDTRYQEWKTTVDGKFVGTHGASYYWYVVDTAGKQSQLRSFTILLNDTIKPTLVAPANNATINTSYVTLEASDNMGVAEYYLGKYGGSVTKVNGCFVGSLTSGTKYFWYAVDYNGNTSNTYYFTTNATETGIKNIFPINKERVATFGLYLQATSTSEIVQYYYQPNNGSTVWSKSETGYIERLNYDIEYLWYAEDSNGNKSEVSSFIYDYSASHNEDGITMITPAKDGYINQNFITLQATATAGLNYFRYKVNNAVNYSTCILKGDSCNIKNLANNDHVILHAVDGNYSYGGYIHIYVDLEKPTPGKISITGEDVVSVSIPVGNDNLGASYYYRVNHGEWIKYTDTVSLTYSNRGTYLIETKAIDNAGNEVLTNKTFTIGELINAPTLTVSSGVVGGWTNQDITVTIKPVNEHANYYCIDTTCTELNEEITLTFSEEQNVTLYTKTTDDGINYFESDPMYIMIDKTAPIIGKVFAPEGRYNLNAKYTYISLDTETIVEDSGVYTIYYKMIDVDKDWVELYEGRVPLYGYYLAKSGTYYVDLMIVDAAGNESEIHRVELLVDVQGPSINIEGKPTLYVEYDDAGNATKWTIKFLDITDDYGYIYHIHYQMWDLAAFNSGADSVVNISYYTPEDTNSFEYDATDLDNTTWYFLLYVCDNYNNCSYSNLYYYTKTDKGPGVSSGGNSTIISSKSDTNYQSVILGILVLFISIKRKVTL